MTTLDNGIVIEESINAHNFTRAADCPYVFGLPRNVSGGTVHWWGAFGQKFDDVVAYLASNNARQSSAHFVVQEDRVACIVTPDDAAWHAGNAEGNAITIGIECRPEMTPGDLETLGSLLRFLETVYGSLNIYIHSNWANTACPGTYANEIDNLVAEINGIEVWHKVPEAIQPPPAEVIAAQPSHNCCCCHKHG